MEDKILKIKLLKNKIGLDISDFFHIKKVKFYP